ncbi:MAG: serine protease, partial [Solirubrobacterales bacterium]|nr:serine protease [Solirubrobacterales bacterium]
MLRTSAGILAAVGVAAAAAPSSASAIVGGSEVPAGKYPAIANVVISSAFGCTGTLIAPNWILTAGHCSSLTGGLGIATPLAYPPSSFTATVGTVNASGAGGERVSVDRVVVPPSYLLTAGFDTSLLRLTKPAATPPTPVAGRGYEGLYAADVLTDVTGFGVTSEGGDAPARLQEVPIPVVGDAPCAAGNGSFEARTQLCGGYAEGAKDSCQGDSGGPMLTETRGGLRFVVGTVSYGDGCARADSPGVYARVAADTLREFIRSNAPAG